MGYPRRDDGPHLAHHVSTRGNDGRSIHDTVGDYERWQLVLADVCDRYGWRCHAYVQMRNHYHLLVTTPAGTLSAGARWLNGRFARDRNEAHGRTGHLFGRRAWSDPVNTAVHFHRVARYIHRNPVTAGLVPCAEAFPWSSAPAILGLEPAPWFLDRSVVLAAYADAPGGPEAGYRDALARPDTEPDPLEGLTLDGEAIRGAAAAGVSAAAIAEAVGVHRSTIYRLLHPRAAA